MPERSSRPRPIVIAGAVGLVEALALVGYALSIVIYEQGGSTSGIAGSGANLAPAVLCGLYVAFALLVLLVTRLLVRGRRAARTPFLLTQAFAVVVAQPLLSAVDTRAIGVLLLVAAATALGALFTAPARAHLQ